MKKRMSKILSVLMVSALVVSTGSVARADELDQPEAQETVVQTVEPADEADVLPTEEAVEETVSVEEETDANVQEEEPVLKEESRLQTASEQTASETEENEEALDVSGVQNFLAGSTATFKENDIPVNYISTNKELQNYEKNPEKLIGGTIIRDLDDSFLSFGKKVTLPKGTLELTGANHEVSGCSVEFGVYTDAGMNNRVSSLSYSIIGNGAVRTIVCDIPKAGSYYIGVKPASSVEAYQYYAFGVLAVSYSGADRTIKNKETLVVGQKNQGTVNYVKFKATQTGYITVTTDTNTKLAKVRICNKSKKALSGETLAGEQPVYGVKKNTTYWIKITNPWSNSNGYYTVTVKNTKISEKSGKSQKKAVTIKKNKTVKGTIEATGKKQQDWYKFKLTKNAKKVTINVKGASNDALKFTVYQGKKKLKFSDGTSSAAGKSHFSGPITLTGNWSKGTYYIKVEGKNKNASGYYTLKWK